MRSILEVDFLSSLLGLLNLTAFALDLLLSKRRKSALHHYLVVWWDRIDSVRVPDLPQLVTRFATRVMGILLGTHPLSRRGLTRAVLLSCLATYVAYVVGEYLDFHTLRLSPAASPFVTIYIANIISDALTLLATAYLVRRAMAFHPLGALGTCVFVIAIGALLGITGMIVGFRTAMLCREAGVPMLGSDPWIDYVRRHAPSVPADAIVTIYYTSFVDDFIRISSAVIRRITGLHLNTAFTLKATWLVDGHRMHALIPVASTTMRLSYIAIAMTSFIPAALVSLCFAMTVAAKPVLVVTRAAVLHVLDRTTEPVPHRNPKEFMPFTMLSVVITLIVVAIAAMLRVGLMVVKAS